MAKKRTKNAKPDKPAKPDHRYLAANMMMMMSLPACTPQNFGELMVLADMARVYVENPALQQKLHVPAKRRDAYIARIAMVGVMCGLAGSAEASSGTVYSAPKARK